MTNKEKYKASFSGVEPSDEIKERILNMTEKKSKRKFRIVAVAAAVLVIFAMAMLTAYAATDGEIVENFIVLLNYKPVDEGVYELREEQVTDENGEIENRLSFSYNGESGAGDVFFITDENEIDINIAEDDSVYYEING